MNTDQSLHDADLGTQLEGRTLKDNAEFAIYFLLAYNTGKLDKSYLPFQQRQESGNRLKADNAISLLFHITVTGVSKY